MHYQITFRNVFERTNKEVRFHFHGLDITKWVCSCNWSNVTCISDYCKMSSYSLKIVVLLALLAECCFASRLEAENKSQYDFTVTVFYICIQHYPGTFSKKRTAWSSNGQILTSCQSARVFWNGLSSLLSYSSAVLIPIILALYIYPSAK